MEILAVPADDAAGAVAGLQVLAAEFPFDTLDPDAGGGLPVLAQYFADIGQQKVLTVLLPELC